MHTRLGSTTAGHRLSPRECATSFMSYSRAIAYIRPPVAEPHRLTLSGERFRILLETDAEIVDKLPLRVALQDRAGMARQGR
jgi:hypothetical protein